MLYCVVREAEFLTLMGPSGREVMPTDVHTDTRPRAELQSWFPGLSPFAVNDRAAAAV